MVAQKFRWRLLPFLRAAAIGLAAAADGRVARRVRGAGAVLVIFVLL